MTTYRVSLNGCDNPNPCPLYLTVASLQTWREQHALDVAKAAALIDEIGARAVIAALRERGVLIQTSMAEEV